MGSSLKASASERRNNKYPLIWVSLLRIFFQSLYLQWQVWSGCSMHVWLNKQSVKWNITHSLFHSNKQFCVLNTRYFIHFLTITLQPTNFSLPLLILRLSLLLFFFNFHSWELGITANSAQVIYLALYLGIAPNCGWRNLQGWGSYLGASFMKNKCSACGALLSLR